MRVFLPRPLILTCSQITDTTVPDHGSLNHDIERSSAHKANASDPYMFNNGYKNEGELAALRRRKRGGRLERYHRRQNAVSLPLFPRILMLTYFLPRRAYSSLLRSSSPWRSTPKMRESKKTLRVCQ